MNEQKKIKRQKEIDAHTGEVFGIVVFFDVWRNERTGERRLHEIGKTEVLSSWDALNVYAETPNPASQLLNFRNMDELAEVYNELKEDIKDPEWLEILFNQI